MKNMTHAFWDLDIRKQRRMAGQGIGSIFAGLLGPVCVPPREESVFWGRMRARFPYSGWQSSVGKGGNVSPVTSCPSRHYNVPLLTYDICPRSQLFSLHQQE